MKELIFLLLIGGSTVLSIDSNANKQKCCANDEIMNGRRMCGNNKVVKMNCTSGRMLLKDIIINGDKVSTQDAPTFTFVEDVTQYCIGNMYKNDNNTDLGVIPIAVVCFEKITVSSDVETSGILTIISVFFLIATLAVYTFLPQLRDLQGLCYMCMCISMALGFLSLGVLQLSPAFRGEVCTITGFLIYSWMMATFFWMNIICINMYRSVKDADYIRKTERKQYFLYCCYGWGCPIFFLIVTLIANFAEGNHYKPGIGNNTCWFSGKTETWIFFYGPVAVLVASNVVLFLLSSLYLWRQTINYEVNSLNNLKRKFLLSLKLFLVMGITWIFEIASFAHGQSHIIWKIMDTFNCLQGVVIFFLLVVLRKRAIQGLAQENCCLSITRPLAEKLSPDDDMDEQQILSDDTAEVRLN